VKRLVPGALLALTACHSWDSEFNLRVAQGFDSGVSEGGGAAGGGTGAGGGTATGGGDASGGGSPTGGGNASGGGSPTGGGSASGGGSPTGGGSASGGGGGSDPGCHPLCLEHAVESGASMLGFVALADGGFLGTGRDNLPPSGAQIVFVSASGDGVTELGATWSSGVEPHALAGTSPADFLLAATAGIFTEAAGTLLSGSTCGKPTSSWWGVTRLTPDEAWLSGTLGAVCHFTSAEGFVPVTTVASALIDAGTSSDLYGQLIFPDGEAFYVGASGVVVHVPADAGAPGVTAAWDRDFTSVDGPGPGDVIAVGFSGQAARWNGTKWTTVSPSGSGPNLNAVSFATAGDAWAVGAGATVVHLSSQGAWESIALPNLDAGAGTYTLRGVAAHGPADLLISGTRSLPDGGQLGFAWVYRR
jgi:hypothetical protein